MSPSTCFQKRYNFITLFRAVALSCCLLLCFSPEGRSQTHVVKGVVQDSTGLPLPGALIKITSPSDSLATGADINGTFTFNNVKSSEFTLSAAFLGFQTFIKNFKTEGKQEVVIPAIKLKVATNTLNEVIVTAVTAIKVSEDTVAYNAASFPVREGDAVEEILKKLPGVKVDKDGNVTSQGQPVTKIRVNGKDFFGTDVATAIKNLPAEVIKNLEFIDDYGDQAKLTGVKTGEPEKVLNLNIQEDKKRGYFARASAGMGTSDRYNTYLRANTFKGERQISVDGTVNNASMRGNNDGVTNTSSAGINYRNEWNKKFSGDASYSFSKRDNNTIGSTFTQNFLQDFTRLENSLTNNTSITNSHSFSGNLEYKIDSLNYLKISPTFSTNLSDRTNQGLYDIIQPDINTIRDNQSLNNSASLSSGSSVFFNHKFPKKGRNLSVYGNLSYSRGESDNAVINDYTITKSGIDSARFQNQETDNKNDVLRSWMYISYMEPIAQRSYLQVVYFTSRSETQTTRDTRDIENGVSTFNPDLSNNFEYQFTTNRIGLNYRYQHEKYNYTLGFNAQPTLLEGQNLSKNIATEKRTFNWVPSARFNYRFTKQKTFTLNYNGRNNQPSFTQLQPISDNSNLQNVVTGNPDLKPEFTHALTLQYNQSDWNMGHTLFANLAYNQTQDKIVTTKILTPNTVNQVTSYTNTDGFYNLNGNYAYSKPFQDRKYTLTWEGSASVNNNVAFIDNNRNVAKNFIISQELEFEMDIDDVIDLELETSYSINKTRYSQQTFEDRQTNRLQLGIEGRNYFFKDLTLGYDFSKVFNSGFNNEAIKNPTLFHLYTEYRFLKKNIAAIRLQAYDLLNQNTGVSRDVFDNIIVDRQVNRLGRYFMLSFNLRLNKFAGS